MFGTQSVTRTSPESSAAARCMRSWGDMLALAFGRLGGGGLEKAIWLISSCESSVEERSKVGSLTMGREVFRRSYPYTLEPTAVYL